jgi:hypothetical protein
MTQKDEENDSKRRGIAIILALLVGAGVMLSFGTGGVLAASLTMDGDSITTDNGAITDLTVDASGEITYDGAENPPDETDVELQVKNPDGSWETIATETETLFGLAGAYSYSFNDVSVVEPNTDYVKPDFKPSGDGESKSTDIQFRLVVTTDGHLDGADNRFNTEFTSDTATATVTVTNEENSNSAGGSGSVIANGTDKDPSDNRQ